MMMRISSAFQLSSGVVNKDDGALFAASIDKSRSSQRKGLTKHSSAIFSPLSLGVHSSHIDLTQRQIVYSSTGALFASDGRI